MQTSWASQLNPLLNLPLNNGIVLENIQLASGSNTINHKLGRNLNGWFITRQRSAATIYDTQDSNPNPSQTLVLNASAGVTVNIFVF
jgi:hypothetical protein